MDTLTNGDKLTDNSEKIYIGCQCHAPEHIIRVSYFAPIKDDEPEIYFMLQSDKGHLNLWERLKMAVGFVLGRCDLEWHDVIPNNDDVVNLNRVLTNYISDYNNYQKAQTNGRN